MKIILSDSFSPLLEDQHRYLVLCGGRGSGKSEFAARKLFYRALGEGDHRFLVLRKIRKTCLGSVIEVFRRVLSQNEVSYDYNKTDHSILFRGPNGTANEVLFDGLDEPEKIKSIKGITGMWIEEATEFAEKDFVQVDLCLREPGPAYKQIILSFNPDEALAPWLKKRFFDQADPDARVHVSTIADNPIAEMRETYKRQLALLSDETLKKIYLYGIWAAPKGQIFNWPSEPLPAITFDEIFYGGDFGYSVNPAAVIRIYRKGNTHWLEECVYETGLINQDLGRRMGETGVPKDIPVYFDSAEPKSIEELYRMGFNVYPADKGPDSVRAGIDFLKSKDIRIVQGSMNIIKEVGRYKWREDKNGNPLPEPVKFDDHAMDAIRYGIYTHCRAYAGYFADFGGGRAY